MLLLKECLPETTLFIWTTTLPVSSQIRGGLLIKQVRKFYHLSIIKECSTINTISIRWGQMNNLNCIIRFVINLMECKWKIIVYRYKKSLLTINSIILPLAEIVWKIYHCWWHKFNLNFQIDFLQDMLRFEVMEANLFCRELVVSHGYDVLDTHYHLRMQIHR